jgi:DNA-binding GntR family transcriptional regulator
MLRNPRGKTLPAKAPLEEFSHLGTTTDAVYEVLRNWIISGALAPGERLRGDALAKKIKVSRTPVREALRKLEAEGFVTVAPKLGLVVADLSEQDLIEIFQIREALEGVAARLTAENATRSDLERLREVVGEMERVRGCPEIETMRGLAAEYHHVIYAASRNDRLRQLLMAVQDRTRQFRTSLFAVPGHAAEALAHYGRLLSAIEARDGELAERLAREHRTRSLALRTRLLREKMRGDRTTKRAPTKSKTVSDS